MTEAILDRAESVVAGMTPMGRIGKPGEGFAQKVGGTPAMPVLYATLECRSGRTGAFSDFLCKAPGELAPTLLFLASEGASCITGQVIAIDGGRTAQ